METLKITTKKIGENGFWNLRSQINDFVKINFGLLYEGAVRLGKNIESDYYAPERIQINNTRLHASRSLKYADGHKYSDDAAPTEQQLRNTVVDIQKLIDASSENIAAPFSLIIKEND